MSIDWIFGEYKILKKIATGGMAEVFLAKRVGMKGFEKLLAIKRIHPQFSENEEFIAMFIDEAKLAAKLNHRNIIQIYDFGSQQGSYYIAMEYIFGKDLRSILKKSKERGERFPLAQCAYIITEAAKGLEYAHTLKDHFGRPLQIIHRDISPQNILISYEGEIMLADFGIAKAASKSTETRAGVLKGKILYMSPEQAWGKPIDRRTDLYSLGVVLYEMVTQRKIFDADSEFSMLEKVRNAVVEFPPNVFENIPNNFLQVVQKALDKNPDHRYQSAHDMRVDLENYLLTTQERLSEKAISNYLKHLFREEIEEERKILTESTEILVEKLAAEEPVLRPTVRESEKISIPKKAPVPEGEKKGGFTFTSQLRFALILILLLLVGGFAAAYFLTRPSSKDIRVAQKGDTSPPPARAKASPSPAATIVEQAQEKPFLEAKKEPLPEETPSLPVEKPSPSARKPLLPAKKAVPPSEKPFPPSARPAPPEEKPAIPPEGPKPVYQAEAEVKPSTPVPVERPKAIEQERRKAQPVERPETVARTEKEASLKGPEQRPPSLMGDLISQGPQLLTENGQLRILEQIQKLPLEERQNINVKVLECFAYLKRYVVDKDRSSKAFWGQLYEFLEKSNNRNATPLLIRITKDPEDYTRLYAVTLLGSIGDHRAIGDLQQIANSDPNRKIRRSAARSVALIQKRG
jgi:serine/threonine protein kinase